MLIACIFRLAQMQLFPNSSVQVEIEKLKSLHGDSQQLQTIRGEILDRYDKVLAKDVPTFWLNIDYQLSQYWDPNVQDSLRLIAGSKNKPEALEKANKKIQDKVEEIKNIMEMCTHFGFAVPEIQKQIDDINKVIWNYRVHIAWKRNYPDVPFEEAVPDPNRRLLMAYDIDLAEMHDSYSLFELETDDDVFTAQFEFMDIDGIEIITKGKRIYPYDNIACQTIGWVGPATQPEDTDVFEDDKLMRYLPDEVCGREDGVEKVCEPILRGKRGEESSDIDHQLINRTEPQFGKPVKLTLDIELQKKIQNYMASYKFDPDVGPGAAEVIIDVNSGDILVMASIPDYNNNRARYDYPNLVTDSNHPLINRVINARYPAGSVVKPLILAAGMETGKVTSDEIISCPAHEPPEGWPRCWIWRQDHTGHDNMWTNNARNALKGSCNVYFSHVADRLDSDVLQNWLYRFGYGHKILASLCVPDNPELARDMRQLCGSISSTNIDNPDPNLEQLPPIIDRDKKRFGIGQANLRVTPLQAANAIAAIARGGIYMNPRLFKDLPESNSVPLNISQHTLDTIYDGMHAVVNERDGTAYSQFSPSLKSFTQQDVKIYGKTGSTERPDHAWFAGFAKDSTGRKLAFAAIVEGGQHGARDAAPFIRESIQYCIDEGYIGKTSSR
jgi:penicillin-binding protein 2